MSRRLARDGEVDVTACHLLDLEQLAQKACLDRIGVTEARPFLRTRVELQERSGAGIRSDMEFTYRNPERSTDPLRIMRGAASLVVAAKSYPVEAPRPPAPGVYGRVARYATGEHYEGLRRGLEVVADHLRALGGRANVVFDDNALVDREAARRAGLGTYGKNSNLLLEGAGSWFVLGSVVTDLKLRSSRPPQNDPCRGCRRCIDQCPTGAIVDEGVVDARRCLAWLVQARGDFPVEFREALHDRLYGCDTCQEVCPENRVTIRPGTAADTWIDVVETLDATDEELLQRHGNWYLADRDPDVVRRNALVVLGNVAAANDPEAIRVLVGALSHESPVVRGHAVWAARRLGLDDLIPPDDPSPSVLAELEHPVAVRG